MSTRLDIRKTYKLFIGGNFVRSESGRCLAVASTAGVPLDNVSHASKKDLRDAVTAARGAFSGWSRKTAYLRSQILYRAGEMLESRLTELANQLCRSTGDSPAKARREVEAAIDRLVYFAGWTDKFGQVFSSVNPVASSHFNFTIPEPTGVVVILGPDLPSLLPIITMMSAVILSGNAAIILASDRHPLPAATLSEILATSDFPPGVINLLTGKRGELSPHIASHMDINAVVDGSNDASVATTLQSGAGMNLKRYSQRAMEEKEWFGAKGENPYSILETVEMKTAWHPIGL